MAKQRRTEEYCETKFIRELRKKNQKLAAENRQLRKEIKKLKESIIEDPYEDEIPHTNDLVVSHKKYECNKCGAYTKNIVEIGVRTLYHCDGCGSRGIVKNGEI